ncbi:MAG: ATP-dependent helicase RecG [Gaiellaceae bacterium]|nr:ATP-dependent helicase RecG [Gaiellaceae bacterium]
MRPFAAVLDADLPRPRTAPDPGAFAVPVPVPDRQRTALQALHIETVGDLLETLPFRFDDFTQVQPLAPLRPGDDATVLVTVESVSERPTSRPRLRIIQARVSDPGGGSGTLSWFNQRYLLRVLEPGMLLLVRGEVRSATRGPEISVKTFEIVATPEEAERGESAAVLGLAPIYHASSKISSRSLRDLAAAALEGAARIGDPLPPSLRVRNRLPLRRDAIIAGHRPRTVDEHRVARDRLAYEELLLLQVALLRHRAAVAAAGRAEALPSPGDLVGRYIRGLPFALTGAQSRALDEIGADLGGTEPMQRLLQGDVGSGKTAVALAVLLRALESGGQAALMAPTEVLAVQHLLTAERLLDGLGVELCLLTGDVPKRELDVRRQRIAAGEPLIAIGTHALLYAEFARLTVAVIDEQHRFGVDQREALGRGATPHVLHMTATPIPRSLALTLYGDLDVTVLDELPPGRHPVITRNIPESKREDGYRWIVEQVQAGRQAYIVCPLVEGSIAVEARAAEAEATRLAAGPLAAVTVDFVHGQMKAANRAERMRRFAAGDLGVLVATTVIEVGVDVPNASVMVIEDADRFGLSQLHQLRGRVGRGAEQSYCFLYESREPTEDGASRLQALVEHSSGFDLAEIDLDMRGEGHLLGQLQSGRSDFRHARLSRDRELLEQARNDARALLESGGERLLEEAADERFGALIAGIRRG